MQFDAAAAEQGRRAPGVTELDIYPIVVSQGIRNGPGHAHADLELVDYI